MSPRARGHRPGPRAQTARVPGRRSRGQRRRSGLRAVPPGHHDV